MGLSCHHYVVLSVAGEIHVSVLWASWLEYSKSVTVALSKLGVNWYVIIWGFFAKQILANLSLQPYTWNMHESMSWNSGSSSHWTEISSICQILPRFYTRVREIHVYSVSSICRRKCSDEFYMLSPSPV